MSLSLGGADVNIESVYNWLSEVFSECGAPEGGEVDPVEVLLVPEVDLVELLHVESLVSEGRQVKVSARRKHFPARPEELLGVKEGLQHPLIE